MIALWGGASLDNPGDRLLFSVTERELARRLPGTAFHRFCPWAGPGERRASPLWVDGSGRWPGRDRCDAVVVVGGVFGGPPFLNPLLQCFTLGADPAAFAPGTAVAWHGVGLDDQTPPPDRPGWHAYLRAVAERIDHFTVRGANAAGRFAAAGATIPRVVPDPAFALPPATGAGRPAGRPRIGVVAGDAAAGPELRAALADAEVAMRYVTSSGLDRATCLTPGEIAAVLAGRGEVERTKGFLPALTAQLPALARLGDLEFVALPDMYGDPRATHALAAAVPGSPVRRPGRADAGTLTALLGGYDLVVASRFHSVILAMRAGARVVAADPYWSPATGTSKVLELLTGLGLAHRHWTHRPGEPAAPLAAIAAAALDEPRAEPGRYAAEHRRAHDELNTLASALAQVVVS